MVSYDSELAPFYLGSAIPHFLLSSYAYKEDAKNVEEGSGTARRSTWLSSWKLGSYVNNK